MSESDHVRLRNFAIAIAGALLLALFSMVLVRALPTESEKWNRCRASALTRIPGPVVESFEFASLGEEAGFPGRTELFVRTSAGFYRQTIDSKRTFGISFTFRCWRVHSPVRVSKTEYQKRR
jgi:hypothetical protein